MTRIEPTKKSWDGAQVIGIDWGGTRFRAGLVRFSGRDYDIVSMVDRSWERTGSVEDDLRFVAAVLDEAFPRGLSVGLALAAMLDSRKGRLWNAPNLGWSIPGDGLAFGKLAERILRRHVSVVNDVSAATMAEFHLGAGGRGGYLLGVFVGTGLGAGFVADGHLVEGVRGVALEMGHLTVRPGGRLCGCGRRGCVEAYVGGRHLLDRLYGDAGPQGSLRESLVWSLAGGRMDSLHPGLVDQACSKGDAYACRLWEDVSGILGWALGQVVTILDPGRIVLGGTVLSGCPNLVAKSIAVAREQSNPPALDDLEFVGSKLGSEGGLLGAALAATTVTVR